MLSIENGVAGRTYGELNVSTMHLVRLAIVVVLTFGVCASGDIGPFPGPKYNAKPLSRDEPYDNYYNPKKSDNFENQDYVSSDDYIPDRFKEILEFLEENQPEARLGYNVRPQKYHKDFHNHRNIFNDEIRPYFNSDEYGYEVAEDDRLRNEDIDRIRQKILEKLRENNRKKIVENLKKYVEDDADKHDDVIVDGDPSEFAYVPPDPRFYEKDEETVPETGDLHSSNVESETPITNVEVIPRGDHRYDQGHQTSDRTANLRRSHEASGVVVQSKIRDNESAGVYLIAIVAGISAAATVGLIAVGIGWYNLQKHVKNAADVDYPAYGVTGPNKDVSPSSNDRRLAQSAQMYHYQHQKQQIIAMEKAANGGERHGSVSEADTDEENEEGDYTVYECPGLAPTGEMEVKNPLFLDDPTPAQTPATKQEN